MNWTNDATAMASSTGEPTLWSLGSRGDSLIAGGAVTSWFVAKDAPNFGLVQMAVGLLLLALVVS